LTIPEIIPAAYSMAPYDMLYVPKGETSNDYKVQVNIRTQGGKPSALVVSTRRVKSD